MTVLVVVFVVLGPVVGLAGTVGAGWLAHRFRRPAEVTEAVAGTSVYHDLAGRTARLAEMRHLEECWRLDSAPDPTPRRD